MLAITIVTVTKMGKYEYTNMQWHLVKNGRDNCLLFSSLGGGGRVLDQLVCLHVLIPLLITGAWVCYVRIERKHFMFCWKKLKLSRYLPGPTRVAREQDVDLPDELNDPTDCDSDYRSF